MKKLLRLLLLVCMVLPMAVYAETPVAVQGDFTYVPGDCEEVFLAGDNLLNVGCPDEGTWYTERGGDFLGESTEEFMLVLHGFEEPFSFEYGFYKGTATFSGKVWDMEGSLKILFVGTSPGDLADWNGTWRILSGTGKLADLHGQGIFYNNTDDYDNKILGDIHIEGQMH